MHGCTPHSFVDMLSGGLAMCRTNDRPASTVTAQVHVVVSGRTLMHPLRWRMTVIVPLERERISPAESNTWRFLISNSQTFVCFCWLRLGVLAQRQVCYGVSNAGSELTPLSCQPLFPELSLGWTVYGVYDVSATSNNLRMPHHSHILRGATSIQNPSPFA